MELPIRRHVVSIFCRCIHDAIVPKIISRVRLRIGIPSPGSEVQTSTNVEKFRKERFSEMTGKVDARLTALNIELPDAPAPAANYVPFVLSGNLVFVSGQVPWVGGERNFVGKGGIDYTVDEGQDAARTVALNIIAQVKAACDGDLDLSLIHI